MANSQEGEATESFALPPGTCSDEGPGSIPPEISVLTKAVQDVVKIIEIIVALLYNSPVAHSVIEPAVGVRHCTCTGRGNKGAEGMVTTQSVTLTEDKMLMQSKV